MNFWEFKVYIMTKQKVNEWATVGDLIKLQKTLFKKNSSDMEGLFPK